MALSEISRQALIDRATNQIELEVVGSVELLCEFILPQIMNERISSRSDEAKRIKREILNFTDKVKSAHIQYMDIVEYFEQAPLYGGKPAAKLNSQVLYNEHGALQEFNTIWVLSCGVWYTTALYKKWFE